MLRDWASLPHVRLLLDAFDTPVTLHAIDGVELFRNAAARALFGVDGETRFELPSGVVLSVGELAETNARAPEAGATVLLRGNGALRPALRVRAFVVRESDGTARGLLQRYDPHEGDRATLGVDNPVPVLAVGDRILLQPLIGLLDERRAARAMEKLLDTIGVMGAKVAIVDITGVSAVDTDTANHLLRSLAAARLLGCEVILSGVSPPIARTMTLLGLDLSAIRTKRDAAAAIAFGRRWIESSDLLGAREGAQDSERVAAELHASDKPPDAVP